MEVVTTTGGESVVVNIHLLIMFVSKQTTKPRIGGGVVDDDLRAWPCVNYD